MSSYDFIGFSAWLGFAQVVRALPRQSTPLTPSIVARGPGPFGSQAPNRRCENSNHSSSRDQWEHCGSIDVWFSGRTLRLRCSDGVWMCLNVFDPSSLQAPVVLGPSSCPAAQTLVRGQLGQDAEGMRRRNQKYQKSCVNFSSAESRCLSLETLTTLPEASYHSSLLAQSRNVSEVCTMNLAQCPGRATGCGICWF